MGAEYRRPRVKDEAKTGYPGRKSSCTYLYVRNAPQVTSSVRGWPRWYKKHWFMGENDLGGYGTTGQCA